MGHEEFMRKAISIAKKGEGMTNPNPMVGAVIVKDGTIIGEGFHGCYGGLHAEREAISSLRESADGATMYVTLEPCNHTGKQPPCTEAIIASGIKKVFVGSSDPNPIVSGGGIKALRENGIEVIEHFLKDECDSLNPVFFHYITTKTPYVRLKYAMTADGKIATVSGLSKWITGDKSRNEVHRMRHCSSGIMVGIGTVMADDPMLDCRIEEMKSPVRIIVDSGLKIKEESRICRTASQYPTILACAFEELPQGIISAKDAVHKEKALNLMAKGIQIINAPNSGKVDLCLLMKILGNIGIDSILLEGGSTLAASALEHGLVNEIYVMMAPKIFGGMAKTPVGGTGVESPDMATILQLEEIKRFDDDLCVKYKVIKK